MASRAGARSRVRLECATAAGEYSSTCCCVSTLRPKARFGERERVPSCQSLLEYSSAAAGALPPRILDVVLDPIRQGERRRRIRAAWQRGKHCTPTSVGLLRRPAPSSRSVGLLLGPAPHAWPNGLPVRPGAFAAFAAAFAAVWLHLRVSCCGTACSTPRCHPRCLKPCRHQRTTAAKTLL
jgi:hypothetical protein